MVIFSLAALIYQRVAEDSGLRREFGAHGFVRKLMYIGKSLCFDKHGDDVMVNNGWGLTENY